MSMEKKPICERCKNSNEIPYGYVKEYYGPGSTGTNGEVWETVVIKYLDTLCKKCRIEVNKQDYDKNNSYNVK